VKRPWCPCPFGRGSRGARSAPSPTLGSSWRTWTPPPPCSTFTGSRTRGRTESGTVEAEVAVVTGRRPGSFADMGRVDAFSVRRGRETVAVPEGALEIASGTPPRAPRLPSARTGDRRQSRCVGAREADPDHGARRNAAPDVPDSQDREARRPTMTYQRKGRTRTRGAAGEIERCRTMR
jgi:hypothetical protein